MNKYIVLKNDSTIKSFISPPKKRSPDGNGKLIYLKRFYMRSISSRLAILTLVVLTFLCLPMAQAKGGGGGGGGGGKTGGIGGGGGRATDTGRGGGSVGGYGGVGSDGTSASPDPQAPKKANQVSDTSNYGKGSTK